MSHSQTLQNSWQRFGPTILRVGLGVIFAVHGYQKVFMQGFGDVGELFAGLGIPAAMFFAYVVSLAELIGGVALILGLYVRWFAALLAVIMLVATLVVHLPNGFSASSGGYEFTLMLIFANVSLLFSGAGAWALSEANGTTANEESHQPEE